MSTVTCIGHFSEYTSQNLSSQATVGISIGLQCIMSAVKELNFAYEKEQQIMTCDNEIVNVNLLITTLDGKKVGVVEKNDGLAFVVTDAEDALTIAAIKKIRQRYSKHLLMHQMQAKGYSKVKEEKLPNGKIRIIVEREE